MLSSREPDFFLADRRIRPQLNLLEGPDGDEVAVEPKSLEVLVTLAHRPGEVIRKRRLLAAVWGDTFVTDGVLTRAIWELRQALGDDAKEPHFIQTVPRRGYRLVAPVSRVEEPPDPRAASIGPYRLGGKLGGGGMGEVWAADDTRLRRTVALKLLAPELVRDPDARGRFLREARSAAALDHPNVCAVFDVGETDDGSMYLALALCEGETLKAKLERGPLPATEALELAAQMAQGLAAAHAKGIVHRDVKPSNVMVTPEGQVKLLDFGLAKLAGASRLTRVGGTVGTPAYMAPEQAKGEEVDARADLWALGVVLFEMLTGTLPFRGDTSEAVIYAILHEEPRPLKADHLPPEVEPLVRRLLEKAPAARCPDAETLIADLRQLRGAVPQRASRRVAPTPLPGQSAAEATIPTAAQGESEVRPAPRRRRWPRWLLAAAAPVAIAAIALAVWLGRSAEVSPAAVSIAPGPGSEIDPNRVVVAPFDNRTGDPSLDALGLLAADSITQAVAQTGIAEVVPGRIAQDVWQSVIQAERDHAADPLRTLAETTRGGLVISGAYYLEGASIRIQASLIDVTTGDLTVALGPVNGPRSAPAGAVTEMQEIALGAIASVATPGGRVTTELAHLSKAPRYEAYLEYVEAERLVGEDRVSRLERAVELDPDFLPPRISLAVSYRNAGRFVDLTAELEILERNRARLTPYERQWVAFLEARLNGRWLQTLEATQELNRIAGRDPRYGFEVGVSLVRLNRPRQAAEALEAVELGEVPRDWASAQAPLHQLGICYHLLGEYERQLEVAQKGRREFPDRLVFYRHTIGALAALGRLEEIEVTVDELLQLPPTTPGKGNAGRALRYASAELRAHGHRIEAVKVAERTVAWYQARAAEETVGSTLGYALVLHYAERWDEARTLLEQLYADDPKSVSYLGFLGALAARAGDRDEALRISEELRIFDRPYLNGFQTYWRASIAGLLGDLDEGVALYKEAMANGYGHDIHRHRDIDLEPLWAHPEYQEIMRPKG